MAYYPPVVVEDRASTAHIVVAWVFAVLTALYLLPWAIAATRSHPSRIPIMLINIFLGWSGVGWLAALIWACISPSRPTVVVPGVTVAPMIATYPVAALPPGPGYSATSAYPVSAVTAYPVSGPSAGYPSSGGYGGDPYASPYADPYASGSSSASPYSASTYSASPYSASPYEADVTATQPLPGTSPDTQPWPVADWHTPAPDGTSRPHG